MSNGIITTLEYTTQTCDLDMRPTHKVNPMHTGEAQGAHEGAHALTPAPRAASASSTAPDARDTLTAARLSTTRLLSFVAITVQPAGK